MDKKEKSSSIQPWLTIISCYENEFKPWETRSFKILKQYRDDRGDTVIEGDAKFNILWSNIQTLMPAVYSRTPKPDVSRRFRDNDPVGRVASLMIERALEFEIDHYSDYRSALKNVVFDRFVGGRGIAWVRYEPHFRAAQQQLPEEGSQLSEDIDVQDDVQEEIDYECCPVDYVHWKDFGHTLARTWEEVTAVWRKVYLGRRALVERFGEDLGNKIPLDTKPKEEKKNISDSDKYQACIYEIWDKQTGKAIWLSMSMPNILDEREDPLGLENFFPCPRPLYATITTENLIPTPDFTLYQDQARELNVLCQRVDELINALQVRGVYDAAIPELSRLFSEGGNNELIPVKNWNTFTEKNGLSGAIDIVDITPIARALNECYSSIDKVKAHIFEIMGVADILRGASDPRETLGAQQIKGQFGGLRLKAMQGDVIQFATDLLHIKAQIICKKFQPETIIAISAASQLSQQDQQMIPAALELITNSPLRDFRIEVSSDSMMQLDDSQEKQDRMEFLRAVGMYMQQSLQLVQASPESAPLAVELLKFGVTGFKVGKSIEGAFDTSIDQLKQAAMAPKEQKQDPAQLAMQAEQMKAQFEQQAKQQEFALEQQRMQMEFQFKQQEQKNQMEMEAHKQQVQAQQIEHQNQLEAQRAQLDSQNQMALEKMRFDNESMLAESKRQLDYLIAQMNNSTKVQVAEVQKEAEITKSQIEAANKASETNPLDPFDMIQSVHERMKPIATVIDIKTDEN